MKEYMFDSYNYNVGVCVLLCLCVRKLSVCACAFVSMSACALCISNAHPSALTYALTSTLPTLPYSLHR